MENKIIRQTPTADKIYTPQMIRRAIGKQCTICNKYISESEANNKDFHYSKTRHGSEVFVHKKCFGEEG